MKKILYLVFDGINTMHSPSICWKVWYSNYSMWDDYVYKRPQLFQDLWYQGGKNRQFPFPGSSYMNQIYKLKLQSNHPEGYGESFIFSIYRKYIMCSEGNLGWRMRQQFGVSRYAPETYDMFGISLL